MEKSNKILILVENYPDNNGNVALMYVHTRNLYYAEKGYDVVVLNFRATKGYCFQGIPVITINDYKNSKDKYQLLIVHAANLKHHYRFLKRYEDRFKHILFFYHGHEVLKINEVYSKPYDFYRRSKISTILQNLYDDLKLRIWNRYILKIYRK